MFPIIQIGPLTIRSPELLIILGIWFGLTLSEKLSQHYRSTPYLLSNLVFITLSGGILGARSIYIFSHIDIFIDSPLNIFSLNAGLMDLSGGITMGLISAIIYGNRKKISLWYVLDDLTPLLIVIMISISLSHLASGEAYGIKTDLPWGIELWGEKRHPTQIYDFILSTIILGLIWKITKTKDKWINFPGYKFLVSLAMIATSKLFLEAFHASPKVILTNIRINQVIAWLVLAGCIYGLMIRQNKNIVESEVMK